MKNGETLSELQSLLHSLTEDQDVSDIQDKRQELLDLTRKGITLQFKDESGKTSNMHFLYVDESDPLMKRTKGEFIISDEKNKTEKVGIITYNVITQTSTDPRKVEILLKFIDAEYRNLGIMSVAQSILFECLRAKGFIMIMGQIKSGNEASLKSRINAKIIIGPNHGESYKVNIHPGNDIELAGVTTYLTQKTNGETLI